MVEYKNYARNSLQTRLDRSRRYRSRGGGGHNDAGSVGDASVASVDNVAAVSATFTSVNQSVKSKDAPVTQKHVKADCISKALRTDDSTSSARDDVSQHSASLSVGESGKSISRRQRLALKSYRHKGSDTETSYPTKAAAPARDIETGAEKNISRTQENPVKANAPTSILTQTSATQQTMKQEATNATPSTINTDSQDNLASEIQQPNRYFHSPKHSLNSPCESMAYQTSAMEEECDEEDQATMNRSSSSINYSNSSGRNNTPSALHSWKQREQREKTTETGKNPVSRGNRVVVTPKTFQGQPGMKSGSNDSYQPSWSGNNMQMDNHKPKKSLPTGISCASPPQTMKKPAPSVLVAPHLRKTAHLSPSYQRQSTGGNSASPHHERFSQPRSPDGSMYKNILKPVRKDRDGTSNPTEKAAFGGVIETPKSIKVSSLLASFDSHQNQPLMPMNSKDPRIRQSLPHSGLYTTPKKASHKSDAQEVSKKDNKFVNEESRQVVFHPPGRHSFSSARSSVHQYPPDAESVQSIDSTSIRSSQTNSSSPSKGGVAEKYRNVTGRVMKGEHSEVFAIEECHEEDQQKEDSHGQVTERVQQYYKASWKVQTNDFDDEKKCSDSIQSDNETLSPRQSVLSSWNQKYREQAQSVSRPEKQEICEEPSLSEKEETVSNGPSSVITPSIFSMWQQRDNDQQQIPAPSLRVRDTTPIKPHLKEVLTISETTSDRELVDENVRSEIVLETDEVSIPCKVGTTDVSLQNKNNGQSLPAEKPESIIQMRLEDSSSRSPRQDSKHSPSSSAEQEDNEDTLNDSPFFGSSVGEQQTHAARRMKKNDQNSASYPWYKDTNNSLFQAWQTRTSLPKVESSIREEETEPFKRSNKIQESEEQRGDDPSRSKSGRVQSPFNPSDFIDEKKSGDLSVDEDKILGLDDSENIGLNRQRTSSSNNLEDDSGLRISSQQLIYENDSYISNAESEKEDTVSDKMQQFPSKTGSGRSGGSSVDLKQIDSEDISLYVEDDFAKKSIKIPTSRQNQNEKIEAVADSHVMKEVVDNGASVQVESSERNRASLIHPSPKDSKNYRKGYFGDESPSKMLETPGAKIECKTRHSCEKIVPVKASGRTGTSKSTNVVDIWAVSSVSEDEADGDIQFDDTDEWLARDPDDKVEEVDDSSIMSDMIEETNGTSMISSNPFMKQAHQIQEFDINENTIDSSKTWNLTENDVVTGEEEHKLQDIATIPVLENPNTWTPSKELPIKNTKESQNVDNQAAFDPFLEDEDDKEKKNDVPAELFSPNPDPFTTEEAFSPLDWSSPRGTTAQHIGYYNSPDSRLEI